MDDRTTPWWRDRTRLPFLVFLAIAAYFLWAEHQAHVIEFLPWILVLGCAGMHLFMHGGHGGRGKHGGEHGHGPDSDQERLPGNDEGHGQ